MAVRAKPKRRPVKKKAIGAKKNLSANAKIHLKAYKNLEKKIGAAWAQLQKEVKNKNGAAIIKKRNDLMLLLGECNYMSNECRRCLEKTKRH